MGAPASGWAGDVDDSASGGSDVSMGVAVVVLSVVVSVLAGVWFDCGSVCVVCSVVVIAR